MSNILYRLVTALVAWFIVLLLFSIYLMALAETICGGIEKLPNSRSRSRFMVDCCIFGQLGGVAGAFSGSLFGAFLVDWRSKGKRRFAVPIRALVGSFFGLLLGVLFSILAGIWLVGNPQYDLGRLSIPILLGLGGGIAGAILQSFFRTRRRLLTKQSISSSDIPHS